MKRIMLLLLAAAMLLSLMVGCGRDDSLNPRLPQRQPSKPLMREAALNQSKQTQMMSLSFH